MAHDSNVAARYARALFSLAVRKGLMDRVAEEVEQLLPLLDPTAAFARFMASPQITKGKKRELVEKALGQSIGSLLDEFILLMIDKDRVMQIEEVFERYLDLVAMERGIYAAQVITAAPLDALQKLQLQETLQKHTGHTLNIDYTVDEGILGGVIFRYRDELIDGSMRGGLDEIRGMLAGVKVH